MSPRFGLLHGFTGGPAVWDEVLAHLCSLGEPPEVLRPTLLGHRGAAPEADVVESFEEEAERLLDAVCGEEEAIDVLCGYSLGGRLALTAALLHPERVRRLVLIGAHPGLDGEEARRERRQADARWISLLDEQGIEAFVEAWQALPIFAEQRALPAALQQAHRQRRLAHDAPGLARSLRICGLAEMPATGDRLGGLAMPVHLVVGGRDAKFRSIAESVAARLPRGELSVAEGCGHDVVLGAPEVLAQTMARSLTGA